MDLSSKQINEILNLADQLKFEKKNGIEHHLLKGKTLGMIFSKSSTRTRVSFEVGMYDLGGSALFLSSRRTRISNQMVQTMVYKYLDLAGLGGRGLSVHKLRHTAATLMYNEGDVDVLTLKDILGHEQLSTTQIYTHLSNKKLEEAVESNPLAKIK